METWIDWLNRIASGMLFQGGYVTSPTMVMVGRPAQGAPDTGRATTGGADLTVSASGPVCANG